MSSYRKIWREHTGLAIPPGWHIHHIDGDHSNNNPENLNCVSPTMHWWAHWLRGDILCLRGKFVQGAAEAGRRGGSKGGGAKTAALGKSWFQIHRHEIGRIGGLASAASPTGTNNAGKSGFQISKAAARLGGLTAGRSPYRVGLRKATCPHCGRTGGYAQMKRWHFDHCREVRRV